MKKSVDFKNNNIKIENSKDVSLGNVISNSDTDNNKNTEDSLENSVKKMGIYEKTIAVIFVVAILILVLIYK